jgi:hypothetical protein
MIMVTRISMFVALLGILILPLHGTTAATTAPEAVVLPPEAARTVVINDLNVQDGSVSGTVVNKSSATLRGVELSLQQVWYWNNERHPGADSPGRTLPFAFRGDVAPNASAPFSFQTPPLPQRSDGRFVSTMDVIGFTEVGP